MRRGNFILNVETALGWTHIACSQFNDQWSNIRIDGPEIASGMMVRGSIEIPAGHEAEAFKILAEIARLGKLVTESEE